MRSALPQILVSILYLHLNNFSLVVILLILLIYFRLLFVVAYQEMMMPS